MFNIELFDRDGEKLIAKDIIWNNLPTVGQKIILRERGKFLVIEIITFVDEYSPSLPKYRVVLEPAQPGLESSLEDWSDLS